MTPDEPGPDDPGPDGDPGGWRATSAQGLLLARWTAGELAAQWVSGLARWTWLVAGLAVLVAAVSIPVDPDWPFVALGVLLLLGAAAFRLTLALASAILRRLALPRRARHLRAESAAARQRVRTELEQSGVPVSIRHAVGFLWALVRGRRPHARVTEDLSGFTSRMVSAAELAHLRARLAEGAGDGTAPRVPTGPAAVPTDAGPVAPDPPPGRGGGAAEDGPAEGADR